MMRGSMVYDFLGGIEYPGYMQIPLIPLGRWLLGLEVFKGILLLILWLVHMEVLVSLLCILDTTQLRGIAPAFLSLIELLTFSIGFFNWGLAKFMFGNWGMYVQSNKVEPEYGFSPSVVLVLECLLIVAAWKGGMALIGRKENL